MDKNKLLRKKQQFIISLRKITEFASLPYTYDFSLPIELNNCKFYLS